MKHIVKVIMLLLFASVIFVPIEKIPRGLYWFLFLLMFLALYLYYRFSYWVSEAAVRSALADPIRMSLFVGKVPPLHSEDLVRGRLVVTDTEVILFQQSHKKGSNQRAKAVWSIPIDEIERLTIGKVIGIRNGLTLHLADGQQSQFAIFFLKQRKEALIKALGWSEEEPDQTTLK